MLERQDEADYEEFVRMHPELQRMLEKKMAEGEVRDARELVQGNKQLKKKFEEHRAEHAEEIRARKFVESNPEMEKRWREFQGKYPEVKDITYREFLENDRRAREVYEREVVHNKESKLNLDTFLAKNKDARDAVELAGKGADIAKIIAGDKDLKAAYDAFMQQQTQDAHLHKFIHSQDDLRKKFEAESQKNPQLNLRDFVAKHGKTDDFDRFQESEQRKIDMHQFVQGNDELREKFAQLQRQSSKADIEEFVEKNKEVKRGFDEHKKQQQDESDAREFVESRADLQKKFEDAKKKNPNIKIKDFVEKVDPNTKKEFEKFKQDQTKDQNNNKTSSSSLPIDKTDPQRLPTTESHEQKGNLSPNIDSKNVELKEYEEIGPIPKFSDLSLGNMQKKGSTEDQEYVEDFLLSNRDLRNSYVEAKKRDENLTAEDFIKQAGASVARQLKRHELNSHRRNVISNFFMSDEKYRKAFDEQRKKYPKLTEEDFIRENDDILQKYQEFVRKQEQDKVIDKYLKQHRDVEDMFLDYQDQYGAIDFEDFLKVAPQKVQESFKNFSNHQARTKELHKTLDENPDLKKRFLQAKSENRSLGDLDLFEKDASLREELERTRMKKMLEETMFHNFLLDSPSLKREYESFKALNVNSGMKDFLDFHPDIQATFKSYQKTEAMNKAVFEELIANDPAAKKSFTAFVEKAKTDHKILNRLIEEHPKEKEQFEKFVRTSDKSKASFDKFVRSSPAILRQFELARTKNKNLSPQKFVEGDKQLLTQYQTFLKQALATDPTILETFLKENTTIRDRLLTGLSKDPQFLYNDFILQDTNVQVKLATLQKNQNKPKERGLMNEFLKKNSQVKAQFLAFASSPEAANNHKIFRSFINQNVIRRQKFLQFVLNDPESKKAFTEYKKTNPHATFENFVRANLFQSTKQFRKFLASNGEYQKDFDHFLKEDESVIREFVSTKPSAQKELNIFINSNQKAKINYEMFVKANPSTHLTFEEYIAENPELLDEGPNVDVYDAFLSQNPQIMKAFLDEVNKNPGQQISAKEFVQANESANQMFSAFATEEVVNELQNIEDFSNHSKEIDAHIPKFIEQNEKIAMDIVSKDPNLRKAIEEARKNNPNASLSSILSQNKDIARAVVNMIKEDKTAIRHIIKGNPNLKEKFVRFVEDKQRQQADFEEFVKNNAQVKQIFDSMQRENPNLTMEDFVKEAKRNEDIKDLYVKETLYNPDNTTTYKEFLQLSPDIRKAFEEHCKVAGKQAMSFDDFIETAKNDKVWIDHYKNQTSKDLTLRNYIAEYINSNVEVKNKFNKFVKDQVDLDENYKKFVLSNKTIKEAFDKFEKAGGKGGYKAFVNKNPSVNFQFINFIKEHPETLEEFVRHDQKISDAYRSYHMKAKDEAHFDHFLQTSPEVKAEFDSQKKSNPSITFDKFKQDFKQSEKARKMFDQHQKANTAETINEVIKSKEQRGLVSQNSQSHFEFKDNLLDYSPSKPDSPQKDHPVPERREEQLSVGSNALMSPLTGLQDENYSEGPKKDRQNASERSKQSVNLDIDRLDQNHSDTKVRRERSKLGLNVDDHSPSSSFVSGGNKPGGEDRKEDDWEKLSRISRRTAQNKKPVNLDSIEDKIRTLHNLQIDIGLNNRPEADKDKTHKDFLGQKVPLSERNQGESDSASASVQPQKRVSIFMDLQSQPIKSKDDLLKFLKDRQGADKKKGGEGGKSSARGDQNSLQGKDAKFTHTKRASTDQLKTDSKPEQSMTVNKIIRKNSSKDMPDSGRKMSAGTPQLPASTPNDHSTTNIHEGASGKPTTQQGFSGKPAPGPLLSTTTAGQKPAAPLFPAAGPGTSTARASGSTKPKLPPSTLPLTSTASRTTKPTILAGLKK
jgi:ribosomal protein S18